MMANFKRPRVPSKKYSGEEWVLEDAAEMQQHLKEPTVENKMAADKKLWNIEDVLKHRLVGEEEEVLVRGAGYEGQDSWVKLSTNPELASYLALNRTNPLSTQLAMQHLQSLQLHEEDASYDLRVLRQESLSGWATRIPHLIGTLATPRVHCVTVSTF